MCTVKACYFVNLLHVHLRSPGWQKSTVIYELLLERLIHTESYFCVGERTFQRHSCFAAHLWYKTNCACFSFAAGEGSSFALLCQLQRCSSSSTSRTTLACHLQHVCLIAALNHSLDSVCLLIKITLSCNCPEIIEILGWTSRVYLISDWFGLSVATSTKYPPVIATPDGGCLCHVVQHNAMHEHAINLIRIVQMKAFYIKFLCRFHVQ